MLIVIRIRGEVDISSDARTTLKMLGLKKKHTAAILPRTDSILGMIRKTNNFVAWGELSEAMKDKIGDKTILSLKPPRSGLKDMKKLYPKGSAGYMGDKINDLVARMM